MGKIRVVFNVGLFGEGFDIAANSGMDVTIGCVIDAAPTKALGAWLQRCGRALRKQDDKAVILDHAGNLGRHGLPCQERVWTLSGRDANAKASQTGAMALRQCTKCYAAHRPLPVCPMCGYVYPFAGREIKEVDGSLKEVDIESQRKLLRQEQGQASGDDLVGVEKERGYSKGWSGHVERARREKAALQGELFNLFVGAKAMGLVSAPMTQAEINKLKPKALKEYISDLKETMANEKSMEAR